MQQNKNKNANLSGMDRIKQIKSEISKCTTSQKNYSAEVYEMWNQDFED